MENVKLQPLKNGVEIDEITAANDQDSSKRAIKYDKSAVLKPSEVRQYMFKVTYEDIEKEKKPLMVGKLDISWRYSMGECGHLQTHPLEQPVRFYLSFESISLNCSYFDSSLKLTTCIIGKSSSHSWTYPKSASSMKSMSLIA